MGWDDGLNAAEAKSALAWWLEAGVDVPAQDEPRNWLEAAPPATVLSEAAAPAHEAGEPQTLDQFRRWFGESASLPLTSARSRLILPHGAEGAPLMLLADVPGPDEAAESRPIGGDAHRLADRMLAAIGIKAEDAYFASISCVPSPGARLSDAELQACGEIARRHVALARPQRLLLLGDGPCRALLGRSLVAARSHVHKIEGVRAVATFSPRHLMMRPSDKALAWRDLLLLMEDEV